MKKVTLVIIALVLAVALSACAPIAPNASGQAAASAQPSASQGRTETLNAAEAAADTGIVRIGALFPKTGVWSEAGLGAEKALEVALPYVNYYLNDLGMKMDIDIRDTQSDPLKALSELQSLHEAGINTVIGPMNSEESMNVLQYANENSILLLSPSATAKDLSQKDNFFRMATTDASQVDGLINIMKNSYKIKRLIPVYMDDTYGKGFNDMLTQMSGSNEIEIVGSVSISSESPDYTAAAAALDALSADADIEDTAVVLVTSGTIAAEFIKNIPTDSKTASMKWFASADIIGNQEFLNDSQAAAFAEKTKLEGLTIGYKDVALDALPYIGSIFGDQYTSYSLTTWDALWLLADVYGKTPDTDIDTLKQTLISCAAQYRNAFGAFNVMDENGDTKSCRYMRYVMYKENGEYSWRCKGHYVNLGSGDPLIQTIEWTVAPEAGKLLLGVLLPLTGSLSEKGKETESILNHAVESFNQYATECGSGLQLKIVEQDTESDPPKAEAAAQKLIDMGIKCIVGPLGSSELEKVKPLMDASGTICIAPLSTAPSLATQDRIYRLILNDRVQTKALSDLMKRDGIKKAVIIHCNDTYGNEMASEFADVFEGDVVSLSYDQDISDYAEVLGQADKTVQNGNAAETAILAVSFDEIASILKQSGEYGSLQAIPWYGTDSSALSNALVADQNAAGVAAKVNFTALDYTPYGNYFDPLYQVINYRLQPDHKYKESSVSVFDGIWLLGCAYLREGTSADMDAINEYVSSKSFRGLGGVLALDENGDRKIGYFNVYHVTNEQGAFIWDNNGIYSQDMVNKGVLEMY